MELTFEKSRRADRMRVVITGASGFVGRASAGRLRASGHTVTEVSLRTQPGPEAFTGCNAVVHLAGEPVAQRWTAAAKQRITNSRVQGTRTLVTSLRQQPPRSTAKRLRDWLLRLARRRNPHGRVAARI